MKSSDKYVLAFWSDKHYPLDSTQLRIIKKDVTYDDLVKQLRAIVYWIRGGRYIEGLDFNF